MIRSEKMNRYKLRMPKHQAVQILQELGRLEDIFEVIDVNKDDAEAKKNYAPMIKRCDDIDSKISNFYNVCSKFNIELSKFENYEEFMNQLAYLEKNNNSNKLFFDKIEQDIFQDEKSLSEIVTSYENIYQQIEILREKKAVLTRIFQMISSSDLKQASSFM